MNRLLALAIVAALGACGAASASRESSASSCAVAWNLGSTPSLRAKIVAEHPQGAFIGGGASVSTIVWSKGQTLTQSGGTGCSIQFVLSGGRTSTVFGAWKNEAITTWVGPVISKPLQIVPPLNTNVHANGTVGFHG
jgi:hypothetical protein